MADETMGELRQALDDAMLMHTGRSIGDLVSAQVAKDVVGALHAWIQQQLEKQVAFPVYGPESTAAHEPMSDRWLETFRREIALAFGTHHSGPIADAVTRNAEKDLSYLIEEYQRLRAREAAALAIVRAVTEREQRPFGRMRDVVLCYDDNAGVLECPWCTGEETDAGFEHTPDCPVTMARALLAQEEAE